MGQGTSVAIVLINKSNWLDSVVHPALTLSFRFTSNPTGAHHVPDRQIPVTQGDLETARSALQQAQALQVLGDAAHAQPDSAAVWYALGLVQEAAGKPRFGAPQPSRSP
jgi:hypothetical protein